MRYILKENFVLYFSGYSASSSTRRVWGGVSGMSSFTPQQQTCWKPASLRKEEDGERRGDGPGNPPGAKGSGAGCAAGEVRADVVPTTAPAGRSRVSTDGSPSLRKRTRRHHVQL